jgi:8-oxo-dGTP pyrophosphatase MutT (NUDIX family)
MDVIDEWNGAHAVALQFALRLTHEAFAEMLGIARRTVATWHERPAVVIRAELQRALDTAYERAPESDKIRFARRLRADDRADGGSAVQAALAVAISVVVRDLEVLLVCRRDAEPSGITWQFPAGVVKPGADPATIAVRETLAETGVHCSVLDTLGGRLHPLSKVYCHYFLCRYLAGDLQNLDPVENSAVVWARRAELPQFIPADRIYGPVLDALGDST